MRQLSNEGPKPADWPLFGRDYDVGWTGWTYYPDDVLSEAIAYGERWERDTGRPLRHLGRLDPDLHARLRVHPRQARAMRRWQRGAPVPVSHAFVCVGPGLGVEAHMQTGVAHFQLSKYSTDDKCRLYFRRPRGLTPEVAHRLRHSAECTPPFGLPYDLRLIDAMALNYSVAGHLANLATRGWFKAATCRAFHTDSHFICSMAVATVYQTVPGWYGRGCLAQPAYMTDPQQLFGDDAVYGS